MKLSAIWVLIHLVGYQLREAPTKASLPLGLSRASLLAFYITSLSYEVKGSLNENLASSIRALAIAHLGSLWGASRPLCLSSASLLAFYINSLSCEE